MPVTPTSHTSNSERHIALARVMRLLPLLPIKNGCEIDYEAADPHVLVEIAEYGEVALLNLAKGLSAVGSCVAYAASVEGGELDRAAMAELGWLTAELSEPLATLLPLLKACRYHTADYLLREAAPTPQATF